MKSPKETKWATGHGGIKCPCCLVAARRAVKKGAARQIRRATKQILKGGINE